MDRLSEAEIGRLADAMLGDARAATAARATARWRSVGVVVTAAAALSAVTFLIFAKISAHEGPPTGSSLAMRNINTAAVTALALCIMSAPVAGQSAAVQWRVEDGGNGHWYAGVTHHEPLPWSVARTLAASAGGYLVTPSTAAEDAFVIEKCLETQALYRPGYCCQGPYLGAFNGGSDWQWVDASPWSYTNWHPGNPNETPPTVTCYWDTRKWQDQNDVAGIYFSTGYIIEWSADCNSDGIVDYGQILSGQFVDANSNGVPDICEIDPCPGDVVQTGAVDAVDLAAMLAAWGTDGGVYPRADINHDGIVAGSDLGSLLSGWGTCQ